MTLEEIMNNWKEDCRIDGTKLQSEILRTPNMHQKYWDIQIAEKLLLERLKVRMVEMDILLDGYFSKTLTQKELDDSGLEYTDKRYIKTDIKKHIDVHPKMVEVKLKMAMQHEKIDFLKDCIKMIHGRSFLIKDLIQHKIWEAGG